MSLLPIPTPVYVGETDAFFRRLPLFVKALPSIFRRIQQLNLERSYVGLRKLRFIEKLERGATQMSWYHPAEDMLSLYPLAFQIGDRCDLALYSGLGKRYWFKYISSDKRILWDTKSVYATRATMDRLQAIFKKGVPTYEAALSQFKTAIDRIQVIHIINALKASNITAQQMQNYSIFVLPCTSAFALGRTPFTIAPLLHVYMGSGDVLRYDMAFAMYCSYNGRFPVQETSVAAALEWLFLYVTFGKAPQNY